MPRLNVLFVASECVPFAKTGGLADVVGALPLALAARGHDVRVVLPRYRVTKRHATSPLPLALEVPMGGGSVFCGVHEAKLERPKRVAPLAAAGPQPSARVYLLEHDELYDRDGIYGDARGDFGDNLRRYALLSRGALRLADTLGFVPDVVHCHDWQTGLVPVYLDTLEQGGPNARAASVFTVHNLAYQGWFAKDDLWQTGLDWGALAFGLEHKSTLNLLKAGVSTATLVSTVSPRYAREIQTREGGEGLDGVLRERGSDLVGVLNGIDEDVWSPERDAHTAAPFTATDLSGKAACKADLQREMGLELDADVPLIGLVSRFASQKGIDLVAEALEEILALDVQLVVLGSGEAWAERAFGDLSQRARTFRAFIGMNDPLAHRIEAGADIFLMPSRYEPCGLNQMYSQRYGTLPVVRGVGGLDDTVENEVTGFKFEDMTAAALAQAVAWAVYTYRVRPDAFRAMQFRAMTKQLGWQQASRQYEALYRLAIARRRGRRVP
jgi:starch synthase